METTNTAKEKKNFLIDEDELDLLYENLDKIFHIVNCPRLLDEPVQ